MNAGKNYITFLSQVFVMIDEDKKHPYMSETV